MSESLGALLHLPNAAGNVPLINGSVTVMWDDESPDASLLDWCSDGAPPAQTQNHTLLERRGWKGYCEVYMFVCTCCKTPNSNSLSGSSTIHRS